MLFPIMMKLKCPAQFGLYSELCTQEEQEEVNPSIINSKILIISTALKSVTFASCLRKWD